jgi:HEPN domain-containing protein
MNPLTIEWVAKAEADYQGAVALERQRKNPLYDLICFHCQQCAEKYLKAILQEAGVVFPKTHMLIDLYLLGVGAHSALGALRPQLLILEDYAVKFRYPGMNATGAQATAAIGAIRTIRRVARSLLGLDSTS